MRTPTTAATGIVITELDPSALGDADAAALATLSTAAQAVDAPHLDPVDAAYVRRRHAFDHDMQPTHTLLVANDGDELAGSAEMQVAHWDNPEHASIELEVHPEHRGRGVASTLYARVEERARAAGRSRLMADAWLGSAQQDFWERHGFTVGMVAAQRRLFMADLDPVHANGLLATAEAASSDYELVDLPNPAPEDVVPGMLDLHTAMNDSPLDDLVLDADQWPVERFRGYERAMSARGFRLHRLLARRRSDGVLGGHTVVVTEQDRPWLGSQEDTAVVAGHRGHKLGLRLKVAMLQRLAEREPQVHHIDTWNAESNRHMLAVNDALGCVVVGRSAELQRVLP